MIQQLSNRLARIVFKPLYWLYYRRLFGSGLAAERWLAPAVARFERTTGRGDAPLSARRWENEYRDGQWDFLREEDERERYLLLAEQLLRRRPGGVLDLGCGEGLLLAALRGQGGGPELHYVGIDLSPTAISKARQATGNGHFAVAEIDSYRPARRFDAIVFNESLYYLEDPLGAVSRYLGFLEPGGVIVVSMFESLRTRAIARLLRARLQLQDELGIAKPSGRWMILFLAGS